MEFPHDVAILIKQRPHGERPSDEFKQAAVRYVMAHIPPKGHRNGRGRFLDEVAAKLGVHKASLYNWLPDSEKALRPRRKHRNKRGVDIDAAHIPAAEGKNQLRILVAQIDTVIERLTKARSAFQALLSLYA